MNTTIRAICAWEANEGQRPSKTVTLVTADGRHYREGYASLPREIGGLKRHRELVAKAKALADWGTSPSFQSVNFGEGNLRYSAGGYQAVTEVEVVA